MYEREVARILYHIYLYQTGKYPEDLLKRELEHFIKKVEPILDRHIKMNGGLPFHALVEDYGIEEAEKELEHEIEEFNLIGGVMRGMERMMRLSRDIFYAHTLNQLISCFDKLLHIEHLGGRILDINVEEVRRIVEEMIRKNR